MQLKQPIDHAYVAEVTKDFIPLVASVDSFLCWLALIKVLVMQELSKHFIKPMLGCTIEVDPATNLVFSWRVTWHQGGSGKILRAGGAVSIDILLTMLLPEHMAMARKIQQGVPGNPDKPITNSRLGQGSIPWPHAIDSELQMLCSYLFNQAIDDMRSMELHNLATTAKAQA